MIEKNIGWGKSITDTLIKHKLPTEFQIIKRQSKYEWKKKVKEAIEISNKEKLLEDLHTVENVVKRGKTKTAGIIETVKSDEYHCIPQTVVLKLSKNDTKTLVLSRFHMLECGKNYKGSYS